MKLTKTCESCLLSRVDLECSLAGASRDMATQIHEECGQILSDLWNSELLHPQIASVIHRHACRRVGTPDPFRALKEEGNRQALAVCRRKRADLASFRDRVLASVIANTFDYGVDEHTVTGDFSSFFDAEFPRGFAADDTDRILALCKNVVYLTDNCGEIVFDRLVVEFLKDQGSRITLAVRDAPILNDATLADARALGFDHIVDNLTTTGGGAEIGLDLYKMPADLADALGNCSIIISKGMANYESLSMYRDLPPVAYLMAVKCRPVADDVGFPVGSRIALLRE
ncbi:MAG TPA: ARMT1-like domain-containing protein [Methanoregulaceae archaeon]|nr:ARMT1-like domain-containing protein [Methanoregulaceae archaeon]HPD74547.1 ARMT1-like domain-containing protein [Methanoregulaceae archaeon]HRY74820.1 ARMT1-like domain-containing protein [Methanoregulaceae archaeon]